MAHQDERELDTHCAPNALGAWIDAKRRSDKDFELYNAQFTDPAFDYKLRAAIDIATKFFSQYPDYVNYRGNRGKPFVAIKYVKVRFPNHLNSAQKENLFYAPMRKLGVELVAPKKGGYVLRVKT